MKLIMDGKEICAKPEQTLLDLGGKGLGRQTIRHKTKFPGKIQ